ncbi:hypothetical protein [Candidatus Uabimicrobium sp. HlEnr_7]|uniref:hypothetical protein n=1 Tax=Candidatus Uabimicrobium helgolandensis TaxID=3095367 RepID=UPI003557B4FC
MKNLLFAFLCLVLVVTVKVNFFSSATPKQQAKNTQQKVNPNEDVVVYSDGLEHTVIRNKKTGEVTETFSKPLGKKYRTRNIQFSKNKVTTPKFDSMRGYDEYQDHLKEK